MEEDDELVKITKKSPEDYAPSHFANNYKMVKSLAEDLIKVAKYAYKIREEHKETRSRVNSQEIEKIREILGPVVQDKKGVFSEFWNLVPAFQNYTKVIKRWGIAGIVLVGVTLAGWGGAIWTISYFANKPTTKNITTLEKAVKLNKNDISSIKEEYKKDSEEYSSFKKSIEERINEEKNNNAPLKSRLDLYEKLIPDLQNSIDSNKKMYDELKVNYDNSVNKINELEKRLDDYEKRHEIDRKKDNSAK